MALAIEVAHTRGHMVARVQAGHLEAKQAVPQALHRRRPDACARRASTHPSPAIGDQVYACCDGEEERWISAAPRISIEDAQVAPTTYRASSGRRARYPTGRLKENVRSNDRHRQNASLDGVVQDPTGEEGFRHGGWFGRFGGKDLEEWGRVEFQEALRAEALLFGRRSYEYFRSAVAVPTW